MIRIAVNYERTVAMNITPVPTNISVNIPQNERTNAAKIKELMPEAEFTGLSANIRVDSNGNRWFLNNDPYTKTYSKYDAYAYEWTADKTSGTSFEDFLSGVCENGLDPTLNASAIRADMYGTSTSDYTTLSQQADYLARNDFAANRSNYVGETPKDVMKETKNQYLNPNYKYNCLIDREAVQAMIYSLRYGI